MYGGLSQSPASKKNSIYQGNLRVVIVIINDPYMINDNYDRALT